MMVIKKFEEFVSVVRNKENVCVDISDLNNRDYLKVVEFLSSLDYFKLYVERISRCKFSFKYNQEGLWIYMSKMEIFYIS